MRHIKLTILICCLYLVGCQTPDEISLVTVTMEATETAVPPTPTSTPIPTVTPTHTATPVPTDTPTPTQTPTSIPPDVTALQLTVFSDVWQSVYDYYVYEDFNGVDWEGQYDLIYAQIETGLSNEQFWELMALTVSQLDDAHSGYLNPAEVEEEEALYSGETAYVGIGVYAVAMPDKGYSVVTYPLDGPATRAGIQIHDRLLMADGLPVCCDENGAPYSDRVRGLEGTEVLLTVQTPGEDPREVLVVREPIPGGVTVEWRLVADGVGYIFIPAFDDPTIAEQVEVAWNELTQNEPLDGLIIDLRVNPGGLLFAMEDVLSLFVDGRHGAFVSREFEDALHINGRSLQNSQTVPLVVLASYHSESAAEIVSAVLQADRAVVIGSTTAGNVEAVYPFDMEDGSRLWTAIEVFVPESGKPIEGVGVLPDIDVIQDWDEFATDETDEALQTAVDLLTP